MKNVPRMMDYERVIGFESALGVDTMPMVGNESEKFNGNLSNLMHLIENSYDWSKNYPSDINEMRYDIPIYTIEKINNVSRTLSLTSKAIIETRDSIPAYINTNNLPKGYCENIYVQSYMYQIGGRLLFQWAKKMNLDTRDMMKDDVDWKDLHHMAYGNREGLHENGKHILINHLNKYFAHLFHLWKFHREEQNFFVLEDQNLIDALAKTEYDCRTDWLRSPNESIYIMLPENKYGIEGMYVNLEGPSDGNKFLRIYMPMRSNKKDRNMHPMNYGSFYWSNNIKKSMNLQESIRAGIESSISNDNVNDDDSAIMKDVMTYYSNLAAQAMLYITSENREAVLNRVPKKTISVNRKKKFISREKTQTDYWALGGNDTLYIGKPKRVNPKDGTLIVNKGTGKKLDHLTLVPAHFHGYWLKNPHRIAALKDYQIIEEKYDDMGKRMVLYKRWLMKYYKGHGELIVKERKITTGGYEKEYIEEEVGSE